MDESNNDLCDFPTDTDSTPLLPTGTAYHSKLRAKLTLLNCIPRPRQLCLPSKAAVVILLWTAVVSAMYMSAEEIAYILGTKKLDLQIEKNTGALLVYLIFALVYLTYPIAGFLADVYCGRHKTVIIGLCLLLCGSGFLSIGSVLLYINVTKQLLFNIEAYFFTILAIGMVFVITGLSAYQANIIQLGLDQLLDVPSEYLGLFLHWLEIFIEIGFFFPRLILAFYQNECDEHHTELDYTLLALPFIFVVLVLSFLLHGYWKRQWFYTEPGQRNPYKMVAKVLAFAWKHKYPLRRSAFTYNGDENPSRIDFAKVRYGGPFTTEQVEDVKTLFKVLIVLLAIGPIFTLEIALGPLFTSFSDHARSEQFLCSWSTLYQNAILLQSIFGVTTFLVYMWFIYTILRRCIPKTLIRILFGEVLLCIAVATLFIIDTTGHAEYYSHNHKTAACVFTGNNSNHLSHLYLPWAVGILPSFLIEGATGIIIITTFEFISAQSPHSMKGLLIGLFYAIRGFFNFSGTISVLPFSLSVIWSSDYMKTHMPVIINCGFGYLLLSCTVGVISLVLFCVVAKRYKYRERDDPPFNQAIVEQVWANN